MPGLAVWRPDGVLSFDSSASLARFIGFFDIGSAAGSVDVPQWAGRRPWFFAVGDGNRYYTQSGTTLSWGLVPGAGITAERVFVGIW